MSFIGSRALYSLSLLLVLSAFIVLGSESVKGQECWNDGDCDEPTPHCYRDTADFSEPGTCSECLNNNHCPSDRPYCTGGSCVEESGSGGTVNACHYESIVCPGGEEICHCIQFGVLRCDSSEFSSINPGDTVSVFAYTEMNDVNRGCPCNRVSPFVELASECSVIQNRCPYGSTTTYGEPSETRATIECHGADPDPDPPATLRVRSSNPNSGVYINTVSGENAPGTTPYEIVRTSNFYTVLEAPARAPNGNFFSHWSDACSTTSRTCGVSVSTGQTRTATANYVFVTPQCGSNQRNYDWSVTDYPSRQASAFCSSGNPTSNPNNIPFPAQGGSATWWCEGSSSTISCTATRTAQEPPDAECTANLLFSPGVRYVGSPQSNSVGNVQWWDNPGTFTGRMRYSTSSSSGPWLNCASGSNLVVTSTANSGGPSTVTCADANYVGSRGLRYVQAFGSFSGSSTTCPSGVGTIQVVNPPTYNPSGRSGCNTNDIVVRVQYDWINSPPSQLRYCWTTSGSCSPNINTNYNVNAGVADVTQTSNGVWTLCTQANYGGTWSSSTCSGTYRKDSSCAVASGNLSCGDTTSSSVRVDYSFSNAQSGQVSLFRGNTYRTTFGGVSSLSGSYSDTGLSPSTSYTYHLRDGSSSSSPLIASRTCTTEGIPDDDCPDQFGFNDVGNAPLNTLTYSNTVTPNSNSFNTPVTVSVSGTGGPQVSVGGGSWGTSRVLSPGQNVRLRLTSANTPDTTRSATLNVQCTTSSGWNTVWRVTTEGTQSCTGSEPSNDPGVVKGNPTNDPPSDWAYTSSSSPAPCRWTCSSGYVRSGNTCVPEPDDCPAQFGFSNVNGVELNTLTYSNTVTPNSNSFNTPVTVSVSGTGGPQVSVGGSWGTSRVLSPGQSVQLRLTSANTFDTTRSATLNVQCTTSSGWSASPWSVRTRSDTEGPCTGSEPSNDPGVVKGSSSRDPPVDWAYTSSSSPNACQWTCSSGYVRSGNTCVPDTEPCSCTSWVNNACGVSGCPGDRMHQTRTCSPAACDIESRCVSHSSCAPSSGPDPFSFNNVNNANLNTRISSNTVTPTGYSGTLTATVSGSGSPRLVRNGGSESLSVQMNPGDNLQVRLTSSGSYSDTRSATVTMGDVTTTWYVTTSSQPIVNGQCGTAERNYEWYETTYTGSFCSSGNPDPTNPSFPSMGGSSSWQCQGSGGGGTVTCTATRSNEPVDGQCGPAARTYSHDSTSFDGSLCSSGNPDPTNPSFPAPGSSSSWVCQGLYGGDNSGDCTATRTQCNPSMVCCDASGYFLDSTNRCAEAQWICEGASGDNKGCTRVRDVTYCSGNSGACTGSTIPETDYPAPGQVCQEVSGGSDVFVSLSADDYCDTSDLYCSSDWDRNRTVYGCYPTGVCNTDSGMSVYYDSCDNPEEFCLGGECLRVCRIQDQGPDFECSVDFDPSLTGIGSYIDEYYSGNPDDWCISQVPDYYSSPDLSPPPVRSSACCPFEAWSGTHYYAHVDENVRVWG